MWVCLDFIPSQHHVEGGLLYEVAFALHFVSCKSGFSRTREAHHSFVPLWGARDPPGSNDSDAMLTALVNSQIKIHVLVMRKSSINVWHIHRKD